MKRSRAMSQARVHRQCGRGLWRRRGHPDPDPPGIWSAHDAGAESEDGRDFRHHIDRSVVRLATGVRGDPDPKYQLGLPKIRHAMLFSRAPKSRSRGLRNRSDNVAIF